MRKVSMYTFMILFLLFISFLMAGASSTVGSNLSNQLAPLSHRTITVPDDYPTIQGAIDAASDEDTIIVKEGEYSGVEVNKSLVLTGQGHCTIFTSLQVDADNVIVTNFDMEGTHPHGSSGSVSVHANNVTLDRIDIGLLGMGRGLHLYISSSNNCNIFNSTIYPFSSYSQGLILENSNNNNFLNNTIFRTTEFIGSSNNNLRNNTLPLLILNQSDNNIFESNIIQGLSLDGAANNTFHHNVIYGQPELSSAGINFWNNEYPVGGNYWQELVCSDQSSGPEQDQLGSDGINDFPFVIDENNRDRYPLVGAEAWFTYSPADPIANHNSVVFNASGCIGIKGTITNYDWDFGDGAQGTGIVTDHTYDSYGNYSVGLKVTTEFLLSSNLTHLVSVRETPLAIFTLSPEFNISVAQPILFNASSSSPLGGIITGYTWDFGDGNITSTVSPTIIHAYLMPETYTATLTVSDSEDLNSSCSQNIPVMMPTFLSVSTNLSSTYTDFRVDINGTLCDLHGNGLENEPAVLYYTFSGSGTWFPITSGITDEHGNYHVQWTPTATGYLTIKVEWTGNATHFGASSNLTLSVLPYQNQYIFSVESNSTISALAFNTTSSELSFTASGPSGTTGYVKITIAKSLVTNITDIRVYLDNSQTEYSIASIDDSWLLIFDYAHSTHMVRVDLDAIVIPEFSISLILPLLAVLAAAIIVSKRKRLPTLRT